MNTIENETGGGTDDSSRGVSREEFEKLEASLSKLTELLMAKVSRDSNLSELVFVQPAAGTIGTAGTIVPDA